MDHETAITAALAAATVIRDRYGRSLDRVDKGGGDFATAADLAAEQAIHDVLRAAHPGDAITGEETGASGPTGARRRWLVDPLCGTLNYAARTPLVAANVALRDGAHLTAAASADPFTGETYWTDGSSARLRHPDGTDTPLTPSGESALVDINLDPPFPTEPARIVATPGFRARFRPRVMSTTLALLWVSDGRRAAYLTYGDVSDSVHFAAGIAICEAAGCVVTATDGSPWQTGRGLLAAADPGTHRDLLALIRST
ncbi:phosphatase [Actinoplanes sp. SE50]|uniref:inositol monophosphatase family protein n=1 Tax=unclassified Actinoplanes TaxID=2626549 RepID=UPI00023ED3ED|nr:MULTISPECIES: inositol monophosphatase family protein [unclassified Actinoplanes]AEV83353.1 inositol monophosphatase [Actinoplanes sp. SE50/110]ATO81746.1 phosphatase [Actinoplanes sp. SE50]SLL99154.1 phosphatase [Actinoplanes sp. SE50/110]